MAIRPCSHCSKRYPGPSQYAYPAIFNGALKENRKLALCGQCFNQVLEYANGHMELVNVDAPPERGDSVVLCGQCGVQVIQSEEVAFLTVFQRGQERADYYAALHYDCHAGVAAGLGISV